MMCPRPLRLFGLIALASVGTALLGGCIPGEHVDASPVSGQVVDRTTKRPIASAQVVLTAYPHREAHTQTDGDGRFHLAGLRHLEFVPLPYGMYRAPTGFLRVEAAGYQPYAKNEFFPNKDGSPGYLDHDSVQGEIRVVLVRAGRRPVSAQGD